MSFKICTTEEKDVLELHFYGKSNKLDQEKAKRIVLEESLNNRIKKILLNLHDLKINGKITTMQLFDFGSSWHKVWPFPDVKIACVLPKERQSQLDVIFTANVARNRGYVSGDVFFNEETARSWLSIHNN